MSGLVGYASSDEEDDIKPDKPAKIAKTDAYEATSTIKAAECTTPFDVRRAQGADEKTVQPSATTIQQPVTQPATTTQEGPVPPNPGRAPAPVSSAPPGPLTEPPPDSTDREAPSPYTLERNLLRNLTMPTHPNFNIPSSPSPPPQNSEAALALSTTTKKFDRFLELKRQGVHFNERLEGSVSLRNPGLLGKLMEFAGVRGEESYKSTLDVGQDGDGSAGSGGGVGVPTKWPEEWYVENLIRENERREKSGRKERGEVEFVKAKSGASSASGTPRGGSGSEYRKTKFDRGRERA